jgi:hypothetical protein
MVDPRRMAMSIGHDHGKLPSDATSINHDHGTLPG